MSRIFFLLGLLLLVGCGGPPTTLLSGTVTLNGKPVPSDAEAFISFTPVGGEAVSVPITEGKYESSETPRGMVTVHFHILQKVGPVKVSERTGEEFQEEKNLVPAKYATGIQLEVTDDNTNQNFAL